MKNGLFISALLMMLSLVSFVQAEEKAPSTLIQGSAVWGDVDGTRSFPYLETGTNPNGGELEVAYRLNLSDQVILLGFNFDLGANKEKLEVDDVKLKNYLGFGIGPTCRVNYGVLHMEAGFDVGIRGYLFGYIPSDMNEESNGYAKGTWGLNGDAFLRLGVGSFFVGGSFGLENPVGGEPGELKAGIVVTDPTMDDIANGQVGLDEVVDSSNVGKVSMVGGRTRVNGGLVMGFWF